MDTAQVRLGDPEMSDPDPDLESESETSESESDPDPESDGEEEEEAAARVEAAVRSLADGELAAQMRGMAELQELLPSSAKFPEGQAANQRRAARAGAAVRAPSSRRPGCRPSQRLSAGRAGRNLRFTGGLAQNPGQL